MHKKFEINWTKIKGGCQSGIKVVTHNSKSDSPLVVVYNLLMLPLQFEVVFQIHGVLIQP